MRVGTLLIPIALLLLFGCSDSTIPDKTVRIGAYAVPWDVNITGPHYEYEVAVGESFGPDGKKLFMLSGIASDDWLFVTYDQSLMKCGQEDYTISESRLAAIGYESVCFELRNADSPYRGYTLRMMK